jgi:predicted dienelactone hydrolase
MAQQPYRWALACLCCAFAGVTQPVSGETQYKPVPAPLPIKTESLDWKDVKRDRVIPVKIYYPDGPEGKFPVIIFSHGLGGSRNGYGYLGAYWAGCGYVCVHLQHIGSDTSVWQGLQPDEIMPAMRKAAGQPDNIRNRPLDVRFAIDQLEQLDREGPLLKGRLDLKHIGLAGHSFGAFTTLAVAGEVFITPRGTKISLPDKRVTAAIAMSESAPGKPEQLDAAFAKIAIPMMHMTGTLDESPINQSKPEERRVPFDHIPALADQYLIVFQGGDHMVFSGRSGSGFMVGTGNQANDPTFEVMIQQATLAFWDAYLKTDGPAKKWLADGACKAMLGADATLEIKAGKAR